MENPDCLRKLIEAINNKNAVEIRTLFKQLGGYKVNNNIPNDADGQTLLHKVAKLGDKDILKLFVDSKKFGVDTKDNRGSSALHYVLERNENLEEAKILIEAGADICTPDYYGKTPLHILLNKQVESKTINYLVNLKNRKRKNSLFSAVYAGNAELTRLLIDHGCDEKCVSSDGSTLLHALAKSNRASCFEVAEMLLNNGADVNTKDKDGNTPMHLLAQYSKVKKTAELLLKFKADVTMRDKNGRTPLFNAIFNKNYEILQLLLDHGSNVNSVDNKKYSPLHLAIILLQNDNNYSTVELLLKNGANVNAQDKDGKTPLHYLASKQNVKIEIVKLLLGYNPNVNIKENIGQIPLFYAVRSHNVKIAQLLLGYGSDVNCIDNYKKTPLHWAVLVSEVSSEMVKCLLSYGADINALDLEARTPLFSLLSRSSHQSCFEKELKLMLKCSDVNLINQKGNSLFNYCYLNESYWKICIEHIAKLQALDISINPKINNYISNNADFYDYYVKCIVELIVSKCTKIRSCDVTFFNLLTDNRRMLKNYAGQFGLNKEFEKSDYIEIFPIYSSAMKKKLEKGEKRRKLFDKSAGMLSNNLPIFSPSHLIIRGILDCCLSTKDLSKFCE